MIRLIFLSMFLLGGCTTVTQNCSGTCNSTITNTVSGNSATIPVSPGIP